MKEHTVRMRSASKLNTANVDCDLKSMFNALFCRFGFFTRLNISRSRVVRVSCPQEFLLHSLFTWSSLCLLVRTTNVTCVRNSNWCLSGDRLDFTHIPDWLHHQEKEEDFFIDGIIGGCRSVSIYEKLNRIGEGTYGIFVWKYFVSFIRLPICIPLQIEQGTGLQAKFVHSRRFSWRRKEMGSQSHPLEVCILLLLRFYDQIIHRDQVTTSSKTPQHRSSPRSSCRKGSRQVSLAPFILLN